MTLADDVNLEEFVMTKDEFSGADIKAICTEAGLLALRERRMKVNDASIFYGFQLHGFSFYSLIAFDYKIQTGILLLVGKFDCGIISNP